MIIKHSSTVTPSWDDDREKLTIVFRTRGGDGYAVNCNTPRGIFRFNPMIQIVDPTDNIISSLHIIQTKPGVFKTGNFLHTSIFVPENGLSALCSWGLAPVTRQRETIDGYLNGYSISHNLLPFFNPQVLFEAWQENGGHRYNHTRWAAPLSGFNFSAGLADASSEIIANRPGEAPEAHYQKF